MKALVRTALGLTIALVLSRAAPALANSGETRFEFGRVLMGVQTRVVLYAPSQEKASEAAAAAFSRIAAIEEALSDYRSQSESMRLADRAPGHGLAVGDDLWRVLQAGQTLSRHSGGAFDLTVGPLVRLWRESRESGALPAPAELAAARTATGWRHVHLDEHAHEVCFDTSGMRLDFGGIGKGYAAAEAVRTLKARGFPSCLVALSGDVAVGSPPPGQRGWRVEIRTGLEKDGEDSGRVVISDASVSTAGGLNQFVEIGGATYAHIIDPATGLGLTTPRAAAVISRDGAAADGLDTALCVTGIERGAALLAHYPGACAAVWEISREGTHHFETPGFPWDTGDSTPVMDPGNTPPAGFTALFSGADLTGWQGLAGDPPVLAALSTDQHEALQAQANASMREHWRVENGVLTFDGKGSSLQTIRPYRDFEMYVDWRIAKDGDSGIYLRGTPQVQIWQNPAGSGGLYNDKNHPSNPLTVADRPPGEWNRFHILMREDRVTVYLNGVLVVNDTPLENYWYPGLALDRDGPIELQAHGNPLWFRNIFVRELPDAASPAQAELDQRMAWWRDARFGMFIHWGLYAIPAGYWNGQVQPGASEWLMYTAKIPPSTYETLAPRFNPVRFDADSWAQVARDAGMKYVVITSKHHDGFCLFDTKETKYDIIDAAPFKRDIMKELSAAVRSHGLKMGWYHSIMDWHQPDANKESFAKYEPVLRAQVTELLSNYGDISVMWFDGEWIDEWTPQRGRDLYTLCRRLRPDVIVNNRVGKGRQGMAGLTAGDHPGDFGTPEQEIPATGFPGVDWESCMTFNDSWGYKAADANWKSSRTIIRMLAETSSKGGNLLLNVGPTALGEIPEESVSRLRAVGKWMDANGASIYGTQAGPFKKLPWGRCTAKPGTLYLHVFDWPADGILRVPGLLNEVTDAHLLSSPADRLTVEPYEDGVAIRIPATAPDSDDTVIELAIVGEPAVVERGPEQAPDGTLVLDSAEARIRGTNARYEAQDDRRCIGYWTSASDAVSWTARVRRPGRYTVRIEYACPADEAGSRFRVRAGGSSVEGVVPDTGGWPQFKTEDLGTVTLDAAGPVEFIVEPISMAHGAVMNLRSIRLVPLP